MGSMNAMGWVLCEGASEKVDRLWDLLNELSERTGGGGPGVHAMPRDSGLPRYCLHPDSTPDREFRGDDLREVLLEAAAWKASTMDPSDVWRRD